MKKVNERQNLMIRQSAKFPHLIYDKNHIYRFDYSNGDTAYYYCINSRINTIKCKARRIFKKGKLEYPSQKENILHFGIC